MRAAASALAVAEQAETRVKLGLDSPLDLTDQRVLNEQRTIRLVEARARHDLAYVALNTALGGAVPPSDGAAR